MKGVADCSIFACDKHTPAINAKISSAVAAMLDTSAEPETCSGSLINTYIGDYTPYYLTAQHCSDTNTDLESIEHRWFYDTCSNEVRSFGGGIRVFSDITSDVSLYKLLEPPPLAQDNKRYFNGTYLGEIPYRTDDGQPDSTQRWTYNDKLGKPVNTFIFHNPGNEGETERKEYAAAIKSHHELLVFDFGKEISRKHTLQLTDGIVIGGSSGAPLFVNTRIGPVIGSTVSGAYNNLILSSNIQCYERPWRALYGSDLFKSRDDKTGTDLNTELHTKSNDINDVGGKSNDSILSPTPILPLALFQTHTESSFPYLASEILNANDYPLILNYKPNGKGRDIDWFEAIVPAGAKLSVEVEYSRHRGEIEFVLYEKDEANKVAYLVAKKDDAIFTSDKPPTIKRNPNYHKFTSGREGKKGVYVSDSCFDSKLLIKLYLSAEETKTRFLPVPPGLWNEYLLHLTLEDKLPTDPPSAPLSIVSSTGGGVISSPNSVISNGVKVDIDVCPLAVNDFTKLYKSTDPDSIIPTAVSIETLPPPSATNRTIRTSLASTGSVVSYVDYNVIPGQKYYYWASAAHTITHPDGTTEEIESRLVGPAEGYICGYQTERSPIASRPTAPASRGLFWLR